MKLTAADLYQMGMIEHVIPEAEPVSRENINDIAGYLENGIADFLEKYGEEEPEKLLEHRYERFRKCRSNKCSDFVARKVKIQWKNAIFMLRWLHKQRTGEAFLLRRNRSG